MYVYVMCANVRLLHPNRFPIYIYSQKGKRMSEGGRVGEGRREEQFNDIYRISPPSTSFLWVVYPPTPRTHSRYLDIEPYISVYHRLQLLWNTPEL